MRVLDFAVDSNLLVLSTDDGQLKLEVIGDSIIRVVYTRQEAFSTSPSLMMLPREQKFGALYRHSGRKIPVMPVSLHLVPISIFHPN